LSGLNGVDYEMCWQELEDGLEVAVDGLEDDYEELEESQELNSRPSTPLQRVKAYWMTHKTKPVDSKTKQQEGRSHSRSSSMLHRLVRKRPSEDKPEAQQSTSLSPGPRIPAESTKNPSRFQHPNAHDEASGRVQGTSKLYNFLSKFF
jgi:hypothetical protein